MIRNFYTVLDQESSPPTFNLFFQRSAPSALLSKSENSFLSRTREDHPAGVVDTVPTQSLFLLLDFKTLGEALWPYVQSALLPFFAKQDEKLGDSVITTNSTFSRRELLF